MWILPASCLAAAVLLTILPHSLSQGNEIFFPAAAAPPLPEPPCIAYDNQQGSCRLLAKCATHFEKIAELSRSPCSITDGQQGVCCPHTKRPTVDVATALRIGHSPPRAPIVFPSISTEKINVACAKSKQIQHSRQGFQQELANKNIVAPPNSPVFWHARLFETTNEIFQKGEDAKTVLDASVNLKKTFQLDKGQAENGLIQIGVRNTIISDTCPPDPICPDPKYSYRTQDGICNNLLHKDWGKTGIAFSRMIPADYDDGVKEIRLSSNNKPLPSARLVSTKVSPASSDIYTNLTILIWQWGQFLDHDITHTPISKGVNKDVDISCCTRDGRKRIDSKLDPECLPIEIPVSDVFYNQFKQTCMDFVRSMPAIRPLCKFGVREQMNQITSYIDASNVYGSSQEATNKIRSFQNGKLAVTMDNKRELLPGSDDVACRGGQPLKCFMAGDSRVNEQPDLAVMHTVFMRQHNKVVEELSRLNPIWTDEILFQEGRRIVGAQMQHITYNEYLPIVLGRDYVESVGLIPLEKGYFHGYRDDVDATIINAFSTAAFRYGHTLINDHLQGFNKFGDVNVDMELSKTQFVPFSLYDPQMLDSLIRGLSLQQSQKFDRFFSEQLTNKLFAQTRDFGMDLVALNIQRGRDHGIPAYVKWRHVCKMRPVRNWNDLTDHMTAEVINELRSTYDSVLDIDLFVGGVAENIKQGTLLGPTFLCIMGRQFITLKIGDRFYFENGNERDPSLSSFTQGQLSEIKKTTISRIFCDNSDLLAMMQPLAFVTADLANKRALCNSDKIIPKMSLGPWRNNRIWVK